MTSVPSPSSRNSQAKVTRVLSYKQGQALRVAWKNHPRPGGLRYFSRQPCMYGTRPFKACSYGNSGPEKPD